jgi:hypothetical protein
VYPSVMQSRILLVKMAAPLTLSTALSRTLEVIGVCTFSEIEMLRYSSRAVMRQSIQEKGVKFCHCCARCRKVFYSYF